MLFEVHLRGWKLVRRYGSDVCGYVPALRRLRSSKALPALLLLASLLKIGQASAALAADQARTPTFPIASADALDKQTVTLPSGLEGQINLLLLSFSRDQDNQIESWTAAAQALQHTDTGFRAYRIPVAERANAIFRWWANASLRSAETDPELWHWVVPVYVDKAAFRAQLGIADEKSVVALLVDKSGHILWRATGASSPQSRASLAASAGAGR